MAARAVLPDARELHRLYLAGERIRDIAKRHGVSRHAVDAHLQRAGLRVRSSKDAKCLERGFTDAELPAIHERYMAGESSVALGRSLGCHSSTLRKAFIRAGLPVRSVSAATQAWVDTLTGEERARLTAAAHTAVRGKTQTVAFRAKIASTKARLLSHVGPEERRVQALLRDRGFAVELQPAFGPYNVDVLVNGAVAVEVFGGQWHGSGRHAARHGKRVRYLLDAGLHVAVIWIDRKHGDRWARGLEEVDALASLAKREPGARRQYRVVSATGRTIIRLDDQAADFPFSLTRSAR